jgi:hypothetical protein
MPAMPWPFPVPTAIHFPAEYARMLAKQDAAPDSALKSRDFSPKVIP